MSKIRRILINFARAERVVALNQIVRAERVQTLCASRSLWLPNKTKNFLANPFSAGVWGEPLKK